MRLASGGSRGPRSVRAGIGSPLPERSNQLLTNQRAYGIWGLYRAAAWRCGLVSIRRAAGEKRDAAAGDSDLFAVSRERLGGGSPRTWSGGSRTGHELRPGRDRVNLRQSWTASRAPCGEAEVSSTGDLGLRWQPATSGGSAAGGAVRRRCASEVRGDRRPFS